MCGYLHHLLRHLGLSDQVQDEDICQLLGQRWPGNFLFQEGVHEDWYVPLHLLLFMGSQHELLQLDSCVLSHLHRPSLQRKSPLSFSLLQETSSP